MDQIMESVRIAALALEAMPDFEEDGPSCAVTDLLADLMHFCKHYNIDFASQLKMARMHFEAEQKGAS